MPAEYMGFACVRLHSADFAAAECVHGVASDCNRVEERSLNYRSLRRDRPPSTSTWSSAVIAHELHCRKCGYDLRGLTANGRCPECGIEIWESVIATVDPAAARMPSLRNPKAVGNALVLFTLCTLAGLLLLVMPSLQQMIRQWSTSPNVLWIVNGPTMTWPYALVLMVVGLYAVWLLAPPRRSEPSGAVWIDLGRMSVGYVGWLAFSALWIEISDTALAVRLGAEQRVVIHLAAAVFATIGLIGVRGVLRVVGQRSREYRRSKGSRQSVELIILAIATGWMGELAEYAAGLTWFPGDWRAEMRTVSTMIVWVSSLLVLIGLLYLFANAWWIRQALRKPPPAFDQVLIPALPPDTWIPDREE